MTQNNAFDDSFNYGADLAGPSAAQDLRGQANVYEDENDKCYR